MNDYVTSASFTSALPAIRSLWDKHQLPETPIEKLSLTGQTPTLPCSFAFDTAAQASIAVAAAMASLINSRRTGQYLEITLDSIDAAMECTGAFKVNGVSSPKFAPLSGLYQTSDGYIRMHANFDHHRDAILDTIGLPAGEKTTRSAVEETTAGWKTDELEHAITQAGGACAALRTFQQWDNHPQAIAVAALPLVEITKTADSEPRSLPAITAEELPLSGIKVLDLTRILAGPVGGRTLAAYGADVMLLNSPKLPNIDSIAETSRGKLSAHIELQSAAGCKTLHSLISSSNVFIQGYRPGALDALGFGVEELTSRYPGLIYTSLSAYGKNGPWAGRRGYDSLVQTATGFNVAEAAAFGTTKPKAMPVQILDYASGFLMAFGTQVALYRQLTEGGSYHVEVSLARTAQWLRSFGQSKDYLDSDPPNPAQYLQSYSSGFGELQAIRHAARFNSLSTDWKRDSMPPGTHPAAWP